jgi:multicomponent Na+:H+ antiporter subunit A
LNQQGFLPAGSIFQEAFVDITIVLPLGILGLGIVLQLVFSRVLKAKGKGWLAFITGLAAFGAVLSLLPTITRGDPLSQTFLPWDQNIPLAVYVDGLSLVFGLMATGIGSAILLYCVQYMEHEPEDVTRFYVLMLTFISGLVGLVFLANLLLVYLCWEVIGLCSYFLVGYWYKQNAAAEGARKVLVMTHIPGYGLLVAILLLYHQSGSFLWTDPAVSAAFSTGIFILILVAAMAKSVMFPLHTWIPEAMNAPTPVSALLHSACYVKAGVYLIARMYSLAKWPQAWNTTVLVIGCVTILIGAIFALVQTDLKRLLAFSTISQLGYIITGLGLGTDLGLAAGLFYCFSHGLFKGTLFLCAGAVQHSTGTRDMRNLGGLAKKMPKTAAIWLIAASAIIGVPLTNGFVAKWLLLDAALDAKQGLVVIVAWLVSVFTAFYILKATVSTFYGEMPANLKSKEIHDAEPSMVVGMSFLAGLCVLFGLAPQLLMNGVIAPAVKGLGFNWAVTTSWLGLQTTSAGVGVTLGAGMVVAALLLGGLVLALTRGSRPEPGQVGLFSGGDPLPDASTVTAVDFAASAEEAFTPVYNWTNPDRLYLVIWRGIKELAGKADQVMEPVCNSYPLVASIVLVAVIFAAVWLF